MGVWVTLTDQLALSCFSAEEMLQLAQMAFLGGPKRRRHLWSLDLRQLWELLLITDALRLHFQCSMKAWVKYCCSLGKVSVLS